jgi:hypothetical protein
MRPIGESFPSVGDEEPPTDGSFTLLRGDNDSDKRDEPSLLLCFELREINTVL